MKAPLNLTELVQHCSASGIRLYMAAMHKVSDLDITGGGYMDGMSHPVGAIRTCRSSSTGRDSDMTI